MLGKPGKFKVLSLKHRIWVLLGVVFLIQMITLFATYLTVSPVKQQWSDYQEYVVHREDLLMNIKSHFGYGGAIHNFKNYVLRGTDKFYDRIEKNVQAIQAEIAQYRQLDDITAEEQEALDAIEETAKHYLNATDTVRKLSHGGTPPTEIDAIVKINDQPAIEAFDLLYTHVKLLTGQSTEDLNTTVSNIVVTSITGLLVALALIVTVLLLVSRSILRAISQLQQLISTAERNNDLTLVADGMYDDEIGKAGRAFQEMLQKFRSIILEVSSSTTRVAASVDQLSAVSEQTTEAVQLQQSESAQAATAMNQMTMTVQEVARNASEAAVAAISADEASSEGRDVVMQTSEAIEGLAGEVEKASQVIQQLEEDSNQITTVLDVIKGIAEQTNLLALNAAIEAARAGEQGRGFAVVADEVRTLAQRTQESTQEIQSMIERLQTGANQAVQAMNASRNRAQTSVKHADQAAASLNTITQAVATINEMNQQIATAAEEQSATATEINQNVTQINQVSESNAAGSKLITESSQELSALANQLNQMVARFKC